MDNETKYVPAEDEQLSLNDLARMVAAGFEDIARRMDDRFEKADRRFDKVESEIAAMQADIAALTAGQARIEERLENVPTNTRVAAVEERTSCLELKVGRLQGASV